MKLAAVLSGWTKRDALPARGGVRVHPFDPALLWVTVALLAWGLVMVYSASIAIADNPRMAQHAHTYFLSRQALFLVLSFVAGNPDCTEITDECIICAVVNGKPMCSTPGISCVRKDLRCTSTKPPTPKQ